MRDAFITFSDYDIRDPTTLPEEWVMIRHDSGLMIYLHQPTRIATLTRPFPLGPGSIRVQPIPRFAIPCYDYLKRHPDRATATPHPQVIPQPKVNDN